LGEVHLAELAELIRELEALLVVLERHLQVSQVSVVLVLVLKDMAILNLLQSLLLQTFVI